MVMNSALPLFFYLFFDDSESSCKDNLPSHVTYSNNGMVEPDGNEIRNLPLSNKIIHFPDVTGMGAEENENKQ